MQSLLDLAGRVGALPGRGQFDSAASLGRHIGSYKKWFFDTDLVLAQANQSQLSTLSRFGAFVRTRAMRSMRKRKKASTAPDPPSSHQGGLRDNILFAYERRSGRNGVVIGPILFRTVNYKREGKAMVKTLGTVPRLHEKGGPIYLLQWLVPVLKKKKTKTGNPPFIWLTTGKSVWERANQTELKRARKLGIATPTRYQQATYPARPYMLPALEKERPKFAGLFRDTLGN